jgi:hypothetical protein
MMEMLGEVIAVCSAAGMVACLLRTVLIARPVRGVKLPDPSEVPGLPNVGAASPAATHAALTGARRT